MSKHSDPVNHPSHYTSDPSGVECIEITRHLNFNVGNAFKYVWRAGDKVLSGDALAAEIQDIEKAIWYLGDEIANGGDVWAVPDKDVCEKFVKVLESRTGMITQFFLEIYKLYLGLGVDKRRLDTARNVLKHHVYYLKNPPQDSFLVL